MTTPAAGLRALFVCLFALAGCSQAAHGSSAAPASDRLAATVRATPAAASADWPTYHRNNSRSGADPSGPALAHVREVWSSSVDGSVYAEPLAVGSLVIVATENNSLYAFDAASGRTRWRTHFGTPVAGSDLPCGNIDPSGITGTPVIDKRSGVVYAVTFERPARHVLVAVDLATGRVRSRRPIDAPGADPNVEQERGALAISRGRVYIPYGGLYGDCGNYHGWVLGVSLDGRGRTDAFRVPSHREGGLWAPSGPAVDAAGNVYVASGNGDGSRFDFGNAVIRLTPALRRSDFFAPRNAASLNGSDTDLGSIGPLLLPRRRVFVIGKDGIGYTLNGNRLGHIGGQRGGRKLCGGGAYGGLAFARGRIFIPCTSGIVAAQVRGRGVTPGWRAGSFRPGPPIVAGAGLWTIDQDNGALLALDPRSGRVRFRAPIGETAQFSTPAAGGGRVYAAGGGRLHAFGG